MLPGGIGVSSNVCDRLTENKVLRDKFKKLLASATNVLTICTGSFIIASIRKWQDETVVAQKQIKGSIHGRCKAIS